LQAAEVNPETVDKTVCPADQVQQDFLDAMDKQVYPVLQVRRLIISILIEILLLQAHRVYSEQMVFLAFQVLPVPRDYR
jgi:hypothetical protein